MKCYSLKLFAVLTGLIRTSIRHYNRKLCIIVENSNHNNSNKWQWRNGYTHIRHIINDKSFRPNQQWSGQQKKEWMNEWMMKKKHTPSNKYKLNWSFLRIKLQDSWNNIVRPTNLKQNEQKIVTNLPLKFE